MSVMTLNEFLRHIESGLPLTGELLPFMDEMGEEARRITFELNSSYHTLEQVRELPIRISGRTSVLASMFLSMLAATSRTTAE